MASSGVWQNVILCKKPTFDGVCGMLILYNITISLVHLFANIVPTCWHSCQYVSLMANSIANFFMLDVTDVIVTVAVANHLDVIMADGFCQCG